MTPTNTNPNYPSSATPDTGGDIPEHDWEPSGPGTPEQTSNDGDNPNPLNLPCDPETGLILLPEERYKAGQGQPSKFTQEIRDLILDYLTAGNNLASTCNLAGITLQTYYNHRNETTQTGPNHPLFDYFEVSIPRAREARLAVAHQTLMKGLKSQDERIKLQAARYILAYEQKERQHKEGERHLHLHGGEVEHRVMDDRRALFKLVRDNPGALKKLNELRLELQLAERAGLEVKG